MAKPGLRNAGERRYAERMTPKLTTFPSQRLTLSLAIWGDEAAPPVILVHGGRDQKRSWDWTAKRLAERYCVYAYDLRGHGESEWVNDGDYGVMDHVYDLVSLVDQIDAASIRLVSHSLGGNIAVRYTGLFPQKVEKLVAIEGLGPSPKMLAERRALKPEQRMLNWIEDRRAKTPRKARILKTIEEAEARMRSAHPQLSEEQVVHLTKHGLRTNSDGTYSWAYDPAGMGRSPSDISHEDFVYLWGRITCPSLLLYGADSWASDPSKDGRATAFPAGEVRVYEGAAHWVHHDQFERFIGEVVAFLED